MNNIIKRAAALILAAFIVIGVTGCNPIKAKIEKEICKAVNERFAPADSYKCRIYGKTTDWLRGKVSRIELIGSGVRYSDVRYDELRLILTNINYNPASKKITACDNGSFTAVLGEKNLTDMVTGRLDSVSNAAMEIGNGTIKVSGEKKVLGIKVKAGAEGALSVRKGSELWFDVRKIELPGIKVSVPDWTKDAISKQINPVYHLDPSQNGLHLTGVNCLNKRLVVEGIIKADTLMANQ